MSAVFTFLEHRDGVGADQPGGRTLHRLEQVGHGFQRFMHQMRNDFGVGIGGEDITGSRSASA